MKDQYMLEQAYPYRLKGIGNTKESGCMTWRWRQVAFREDFNALKSMKTDDMRIVDWNTCKVVDRADWKYNMIIF